MQKTPRFFVTYTPCPSPPTLDETVKGIMGISLADFIDEILSPGGKYHRICQNTGREMPEGR